MVEQGKNRFERLYKFQTIIPLSIADMNEQMSSMAQELRILQDEWINSHRIGRLLLKKDGLKVYSDTRHGLIAIELGHVRHNSQLSEDLAGGLILLNDNSGECMVRLSSPGHRMVQRSLDVKPYNPDQVRQENWVGEVSLMSHVLGNDYPMLTHVNYETMLGESYNLQAGIPIIIPEGT